VLSADARLAVTFGEGDCAQLWLVATRIQLAELCGHQGSVHSAAFNPSGTALMSSSDDAVVRVWDTDTGRMVQELKAPSSRARLSFSPDGRLAGAVSTVSSMVQLWDARSWKAGATIRPDFSLLDAVFSPDGDRVVLLDSLGFKAQLFSTRDGQAMAPLVGHTDRIFGAAFSADGEFLVTASADKTARVWAGRRGNPVAVLRGHEDVVTSARFSPDGTRIATSSLDGSSRIWQSILFSDVVDLNRSGPRIESTSLGRGERLAWFVDSAREVKMLSLADRTLRPVASVPRKFVFLAMSGDRRIIATSDGAGSILVRRTGDGSTLAEWPGAHAVAPRLAVSPDGTRLVSAGGSGVLWDLQRKKIITTLDVQASASDAVFSPDGRFFVTLEGDAALLRESGRGRRVAVLAGEPEYEVTSARFSPDGGDIVTTSVDKVVRIWRTGASSPRLQLVGHTDAVRGAWFSADGQSIVSVGQDRTARVWDVATGHMVAELPGDRDDWATASFHPHEALVITSGGHNPATLWDARTGRRLMEFNRAADAEADFTTDGKHVVVVSDGRARLYRCEECGQGRDLLRIARVRADRALSTEERRVFLHEAVKLAPSGQQMRAPLTGNR